MRKAAMKVEVHLLVHDEEPMAEFAVRHYRTFAQTIVLHDGGPSFSRRSDRVEVMVRRWDTNGKLNDDLAMKLKNECWAGTEADWVICADADELVYFPAGPEETLATYSRIGAAVIRPEGYEMFSEEWPAGPGQIYDYVKSGAPDDKWYAKPILFSPRMVKETGFGIGAHDAFPVLHNGRLLHCNGNWPHPNPRALLLHFHQVGPLERIAARYDATRQRLSRVNEIQRWGNFKPGLEHAQEKRALILPRICQVVA